MMPPRPPSGPFFRLPARSGEMRSMFRLSKRLPLLERVPVDRLGTKDARPPLDSESGPASRLGDGPIRGSLPPLPLSEPHVDTPWRSSGLGLVPRSLRNLGSRYLRRGLYVGRRAESGVVRKGA